MTAHGAELTGARNSANGRLSAISSLRGRSIAGGRIGAIVPLAKNGDPAQAGPFHTFGNKTCLGQ
jgi:hypothetical protein